MGPPVISYRGATFVSMLATSNLYTSLGFPPVEPVSTLRSVAHLFGSSKNRCGIYLLEFPDEKFYIGQAVDVVRRFAQHRQNHDDICGFSFIPTRCDLLDQVERNLIHQAELVGMVIFNTVHATSVYGEADLDMVLSLAEQAEWLLSPVAFNAADLASPIALPKPQLERFSKKFHHLKEHPVGAKALKLFAAYVQHSLPAPRRTEYSFWAVSCLPSTNRNTYPRLLCVSAGVMELLVLGFHKENQNELWGFVTVASDVLSETFKTDASLVAHFPSIEIIRRNYRDAGQHQITICASDEQAFTDILQHESIQRAVAVLALRVMRKRATIYSKFHCKHIVDYALENKISD